MGGGGFCSCFCSFFGRGPVYVFLLVSCLPASICGDAVHKVAYAEEAVQRGGLAVAASNGKDTIAMCLECPPQAENAMEESRSSDGDDADDATDADDANSEDDDEDSWQASESTAISSPRVGEYLVS